MTISYTALRGHRFWRRHVLLSGPKLQNTNCTETFSATATRHKQQTSGRLQTVNNTVVNSFSNSCPWQVFHFINPLQVLMVCVPSTAQAASSPEQRIFPRIFIAIIRQIVCLTPLLLMRIWSQFFPSWIPFEHSNFSLRLSPHSPIKQDWGDLRAWTSIIPFNGFRS